MSRDYFSHEKMPAGVNYFVNQSYNGCILETIQLQFRGNPQII